MLDIENRKDFDIMTRFPRISHDIGIIGGKACIAGTRITVGMILTQISEGVNAIELLEEYPHLTEEDIAEALKYAAWAVGVREDFIISA